MSFVHLHNHSHYSILDGAQSIDSMLKKTKNLGMNSIALTDHGNMYGAYEFYMQSKYFGVKPIFGMEAYIVGQGSLTDRIKPNKDSGEGKNYHLILLCKDLQGYKNLCKLSSVSFTDGFYYKPRIDKELLRKHKDGLIALTACLGGEVTNAHLRNDDMYAACAVEEYIDILGHENFYLEIQRHGQKEDFAYEKNLALAKRKGIQYVVTNDCHYTEKKDWDAHDVLICMQHNVSRNDVSRKMHYAEGEFYIRSEEEMSELFKDIPEAVKTTNEIADKCNVTFEKSKYYLPQFPIPQEEGKLDENEFLKIKTDRGLIKRYGSNISKEAQDRAEFELNVIKNMGFASYFLIVSDFIDYARSQDIPVGLGRGSAAGSLVAFATGITSVDPLKYNLLFERFLNPERVSMPDVDIDFCMNRREEVIQYVREKYGEKNVCQIITFGTLAPKNAFKDVARVLELSFERANQITKHIPVNMGKPMPLADAFKEVPELAALMAGDDEIIKEIVKHAIVLEGSPKSTGIHAAGVIISPEDVSNIIPISKNQDGLITSQFEMAYVDKVGLLKMDFLGLRTLTVIDDAVKMIRKLSPELVDFDAEKLPLEDKLTFDLYSTGKTVGIFQFESKGMTDYLRKLKPNRIEDLIAMNALYRPGPMEFITDFIDRKFGRKEVEYLHPLLVPILKETYGVIVYQEQVMKVVADLGNFTLGEADVVRRAMGKKDEVTLKNYRDKFITQGFDVNKIDEKTSGAIFDNIVKFASYGFNKSHAAAYSLLSYQTAYIKAHYPAQFIAALMTSEIESPDRIVIYMEECKNLGIKVIPPNINISNKKFSVIDANTIAFGMLAIKNVGSNALDSIIESRDKQGKFKHIFELVERADTRIVNKRTLESLIQAGAFDCLEGTRAQNFAAIDLTAEFVARLNNNKVNINQVDLFGSSSMEVKISYPILPQVADWSQLERLNKEKELFGFYISGHPLEPFKDTISVINSLDSGNPNLSLNEKNGKLAGMIIDIKVILTKKGDKMAFVKAENFNGPFEIVVFSNIYQEKQDMLTSGRIIVVNGKFSLEEEKIVKIIATDLIDLNKVEQVKISKLTIKLNSIITDSYALTQLKSLLQSDIGECPVYFEIFSSEEKKNITFKSNKYRVNGKKETINELRDLLGDNALIVQ